MNELAVEVATGSLTKVAEDIWIVDAPPLQTAGVSIPLRMTVIRLGSGDLLLYSPTHYSAALGEELGALGTVRYLLAPSIAHWMFVSEWQQAHPHAATFAVPGLGARRQVKKSGLRIDRELNDGVPSEWADELDMVLLAAPLFAEVALFHRASRTLVLTDVVQNFRSETLPAAPRLLAKALGITAPNGMAPAYLRFLLRRGGRAVEAAAARLIAYAPERVIFAHGEWFDGDATARLRRSFRWLPKAPGGLAGTRVVITGASSGIGRATALSFARRGASVALAARREELLERLGKECEELGGRVLIVPTDVTDATAVQRLADKTVEAFGGIDVWINNAGTGVFGRYQDADMELHRRTVEVNLMGTMHGAFSVLPIFLRQKRGILINNISLGGWAPAPFAAAYTASKFGLRGFTECLRQELAAEPMIHVCAVFPAMVDTPGFIHGGNVSGRRLNPGPLLYQPEDVAETFVRLVRAPRGEVAVGWPARASQVAYAMAPRVTATVAGAALRFLVSRAPHAENTAGGMIQPTPIGATASGGWLARKGLPPAGQITKMVAVTALVGLALGTSAWSRRRRVSAS